MQNSSPDEDVGELVRVLRISLHPSGKAIARISGMLSFHVIFQWNRYQRSVSASQFHHFRGAMPGRADRGPLITTGTFTRDVIREATREGPRAMRISSPTT